MKYYSEIRVIYADTDAMGIAYHGNYIKWFETGRTEYLRQLGYPYSELEKQGIWLPVMELGCRYRQPAFYDDLLEISCWPGELGGASVVLNYEIKRKGSDEVLVSGFTRHAVTGKDLKPIKLRKLRPEVHAAVVASAE